MKKIFLSVWLVFGSLVYVLSQPVSDDLEIMARQSWSHSLIETLNDDTIIIIGAQASHWEIITVDFPRKRHKSLLLPISEAIPIISKKLEDRFLIVGSLSGKAAVWNFKPHSGHLEKIPVEFPAPGKIVDLINEVNDHILLVENDQEFLIYYFNDRSSQLVQWESIPKRVKDETGKLLKNQFGEMYFFRSVERQAGKYPVRIRKYSEASELMWDKVYDNITWSVSDVMLASNGDLLAKGNINLGLRFDLVFMQWAPNGKLIAVNQQNSLYTFNPGGMGWLDDRTFWSIDEIIPFGARFPDISIVKYSFSPTKPVQQDFLTGKGIQKILGISEDKLGNSYLLYQNNTRTGISLQHLIFNQEPCDQPLGDLEAAIHYLSASTLNTKSESYRFSAYISSKAPLSPGEVRINLIETAAKVPEPTNLILIESSADHFCYEVSKSFQLNAGENTIGVLVGRGEKSISDTFSVYNMIERPNLFIFSVGVVYEDLSYTDKDASDFVKLFADQEGRLFEKIYYRLLNNREETRADQIIRQLSSFAELPIKDEDLVFIFFSSHGDLINQEFSILGSNYDFQDPATFVNFKNEIIRRISKLNGKKILFLDACKSGNIKGAPDEVSPELVSSIFRVVQSTPGLVAISSSMDQQSSYEVKDLQNGVFTAAIKELFSGTSEIYDQNNDRVLTVAEVFRFLKFRVPQIVDYYFKDPDRKQNPSMPLEGVDQELPIFYISNRKL